jgi:hypothetical protein
MNTKPLAVPSLCPAPLAIDLFCGLGGWAEGLLAEGWDVIGFDIERHVYGDQKYPGQLVIQDVLTLHGSQFKSASLIVASPPCQEYSYMAMPWSRAKARAADYRSGKRDVKDLTRLFDACFRIQREACEAAGRHIPLVVENVRGAIPWVGRSRWNFGSFHLWGDVPALMPPINKRKDFRKSLGESWSPERPSYTKDHAWKVAGFRFDGSGRSFQTASVVEHGVKVGGFSWSNYGKPGYKPQAFNRTAERRISEGSERSFQTASVERTKTQDHPNIRDGHPHTKHMTNPAEHRGIKHQASGAAWFDGGPAAFGSGTSARKAASAMIAKIPLPLSRHIARAYSGNRHD